jgi:hypothetical protein
LPPGFDVHVRTAEEATRHLASGQVKFVSLDHDLGENLQTGYDLAKWIEKAAYEGVLPPLSWAIHSANPVGRQSMEQAMRNADRFWLAQAMVEPAPQGL